MTDSTHATDAPELSADISATGSSTARSHEIAPEHRHHADAILAIDPMAVPNTHSIPEGWGASLTLRASALPPQMQREIADKMAPLSNLTPSQRQAKEAEFTADAIRAQRGKHIVQLGVGANATPYHREMAAIAREVHDLSLQHDALQAELERVARYDSEVEPATGEPKPVPVFAVTGQRATAYVNQQEDIARRIRLLVKDDGTPGIEGARRAKQALAESVASRVELERQLSEEAEAKKLAEAMGREQRVKARAESIVRLNRNAT